MHFKERIYKSFIVDDNKIDRLTTVSFVRKFPFLTIEGVFDDAREALQAAEESLPDIIFLDIDMPGINGLEIRVKLEKVPACIFITAYPDYALPAFEVNTLDFIVKPINPLRFEKAMDRLQFFLNIYFQTTTQELALESEELFIKEGHEHIKIRYTDIIYLEALKDYTRIVTRERKYCVLMSLGNLLKEKAFAHFLRIHRSYAVQKKMVCKIGTNELSIGEFLLPVGRTFRNAVNGLISG